MAQTTSTAASPFEAHADGFTATKTIFGPATRAGQIIAGKAIWSVASTSVTLDLTKDTGTNAPGAGSSILTGTVDTSTTANTSNSFSLSGAPVAFAAGDRIAAKIAGTVGSLAGLSVNLEVQYT